MRVIVNPRRYNGETVSVIDDTMYVDFNVTIAPCASVAEDSES